ncbi:MAG: N-acetyltransferase [Bacilli bacterium]|jgi:hypothetical protein|nr:N-acetyltransferase [Bacilli bacterium]
MIRLAKMSEVSEIMQVLNLARLYMHQTGNIHQWDNGYPFIDMVEDDIRSGQGYVVIKDKKIIGYFAFILGNDPTYAYIEDGQWLNNESYGTIHRLGSCERGGVFHEVMEYCSKISKNIRADTHADNKIMQHLFLKEGFQHCGIIYLETGSPRVAFQFIKS